MNGFIEDLKRTFKQGNIVVRLIYINVAVYVLGLLAEVVLGLFNIQVAHLWSYLYLPADLLQLLRRPWTLITYMFLHAGVWHLLGNMLWLYWFGRLFLYFFSSKHLRGLYVVGGLMGAVFYIASYNLFPVFAGDLYSATLVGASASVLAIAVATAVREPDYRINLMLIGPVRLKYFALFIVLFDILYVGGSNAGGHLAHLGGALAGWWFVRGINSGYDITRWVNACIDAIGAIFRKRERKPRKPKMKVHVNNAAGNDRKSDYDYNARKKAQSDEVDHILEKLKKSGYSSLTDEEKRKLFDASNR
jgi:membrane associated rhomboid family serine protease